jgi:hypothetical protein
LGVSASFLILCAQMREEEEEEGGEERINSKYLNP